MPSPKIVETAKGTSYRFEWRAAGRQSKQKLTVYDEDTATEVQRLIEAHRNKITKWELFAVLDEMHGREAEVSPSTAPLFSAYAVEWLRGRTPYIRESTRKAYEGIIRRHLAPTFGQLHLDRIRAADVEAWQLAQLDIAAPKSVGDRLRLLQTILGAARDGGTFDVSPASAVKPPETERTEQVFLSTQEFELVRASCARAGIGEIAYVLVHTGLRIGEACGLRCGDVVTDVGGATTIMVTRALKTKGSRRSVAVSPAVADVLARLTRGRPASAPLFRAPDGGHWTTGRVRYRWDRAVTAAMRCDEHPPAAVPDRAGRMRVPAGAVSDCECLTRLHQRPRLHDLRHTHAAWLGDNGWQVDEVQVRLGHTRFATTYDLYWHRFRRHDGNRLARLDSYVTATYDRAA